MSSHRPLAAQALSILLIVALASGFWLALRTWPTSTATACTFGRPAPPSALTFAPTVAPPTELPAATLAAAPTEVMSAADIAFATEYAAAVTQVVVRATQQPFATAQPVAVQPGQPALATARRAGLTLQVRLPKDTYLDGETGQAEATLSNAGPETLWIEGSQELFWTTLLDMRSHVAPPFPWLDINLPGFPPMVSLNPGQSITATVVFHVAGPASVYVFWAETRSSRSMPINPPGPDQVWLRLEAGPLLLRVLPPAPSQRLQAHLQVDRAGWSLSVTDADGRVPPGPLVGELELAGPSLYGMRALAHRADGIWSSGWVDEQFGPGPFRVRAWVAAPGYVTAAITETVDGTADTAALFYTGGGPDERTYATLASAQASLGLSLYRLSAVPPGATFDSVQAEAAASSDFCGITVHQGYRLAGSTWLELSQFYSNPRYANGNWGDARWDLEAQVVNVAGQIAYLSEQYGWRILDWQIGDDGLELRAPLSTLSPAELLALAGSVQR
jgi:hypothetical protein